MSDIGYRRKGDTGPMYNPERDYAYITPTLMRIAVESLDANEPCEKVGWREKEHITPEELNVAVTALANAQRDFVNSADPVASFEQALLRYDFANCRYAVRQFIFATIGEIFCAAWFTAVREVSVVGEESPAHTDMARFCAAVREFANKNKSITYDATFMAEHLRMRQDVLQTRIQMLLAELKDCRTALLKCKDEIKANETAAKQTNTFLTKLIGVFRKKR